MHKGTKGIVFILVILFSVISCATVSPYYNQNEGYSVLGAAIPENGTLSVFLKASLFKNIASPIPPELLKRADYLTIAIDENNHIYGGIEGRFIADSIRFVSGKNRIQYNSFQIIQPDSGILLFSNADVKMAERTLIKERSEYRSKEQMKLISQADGALLGRNIPSSLTSSVFSLSLPLEQISLTLSNKEQGIYIYGKIDCWSISDSEQLFRVIKTWLVSRYRINGKAGEIVNLPQSLISSNDEIEFNGVYISYSDLEYLLNSLV